MAMFKRFFRRKPKAQVESLRGVAPEETQAAQDVMRQQMEAEVAADRTRRGATDARPGTDRTTHDDPEEAGKKDA